MASVEHQPLKKRRLYEQHPSPIEEDTNEVLHQPSLLTSHSTADQEETNVPPPFTPPILSQVELQLRKKNKDEIKSVYQAYKLLKSTLSQKETSSAELEHAYVSLVNASRGCSSVKRILSDFIPRYASYCPSALESATKAVIDIHSSSLESVNAGCDTDGVAFETAVSSAFGLLEVCRVAATSMDDPKPTFLREIGVAVFRHVLTLIGSNFTRNNTFKVFDDGLLEMGDTSVLLSDWKIKLVREDGSPSLKMIKLHVLCFLRMLFCWPKHFFTSCFEMLRANAKDEADVGVFIIGLMTNRKNLEDNIISGHGSKTSPQHEIAESVHQDRSESSFLKDANDALHASRGCLLEVVLNEKASLRSWMFSNFRKSIDYIEVAETAEIKLALDKGLEICRNLANVECCAPGSDEEVAGGLPESNQQSSVLKIFDENGSETHGVCQSEDSGGSRSMDCDNGEQKDISHGRLSIQRNLSQKNFSPVARVSSDSKTNSFEEKSVNANVDVGGVSNGFVSPGPSTSWLYDGDMAAMDVFPASRQLWLGFFTSDVSESQIRFQVERFGYMQQFFFFPLKGFALVEYRNLMDAVRCRECLRSYSSWQVRFIDVGMGSMGMVNGTAVGASTCIYVGRISSQWEKDSVIHESSKIVHKGPYSVTELVNEGALLLEFETPEEATLVMAHLRKQRFERSNHLPPANVGPCNMAIPQTESAANTGNNAYESPHSYTLSDSVDTCRSRLPKLSSMVASLRKKYNVVNHATESTHAAIKKDENGVPSSTLWVCYENVCSNYLTEEDLKTMCDIALANAGSILKLSWGKTQTEFGWLVECSSIEAAATILKNFQSCPEMMLQIEFSKGAKAKSGSIEFVSPRLNSENHGVGVKRVHSSGVVGPTKSGGHDVPAGSDQQRSFRRNDMEPHSAPAVIPTVPLVSQGPSMQPQFQPTAFVAPVYLPPNSSWDPQCSNRHFTMNPISPVFQGHNATTQFAPQSVPPSMPSLPPVHQPQLHHFDHNFPVMFVPHSVPPIPSQPDFAPPLPSSPPPAPPPPCSPPPPPPVIEPSLQANEELSKQYQWQGKLCKSGVHFCTINSCREQSDNCKYTSDISEPAEWPTKLDMTKRTDFKHVRSTFTSTPPNRREVCLLTPSTPADQKGFQDFVAYLNRRECAGVIKIPVAKAIWSRLLFILPYSEEVCSLVGVSPATSNCLIGLVLPKETNFEWA